MTHFYERNITEIKQEYTVFLVNVLSPLIYEGIKDLYNAAKNLDEKFEEAKTKKPDISNPGIFKLFQKLLANIPNLNNHRIEKETIRIRDNSKIADIFDDLIRAVVKSNIVLLTYNASNKTCMLVKEKYHENIDIKEFIHKCYIECAKSFYNYPELFYHKYSTLDIQRNKRESIGIIKNAINEAIRKIIPMKLVLEEYLSNDYIKESGNVENDVDETDYMNIKRLLERDLDKKGDRRILIDSNEQSGSYNSEENYVNEDGDANDGEDDDEDEDEDEGEDETNNNETNNTENSTTQNATELENMILNADNNGENNEKPTQEDISKNNVTQIDQVEEPNKEEEIKKVVENNIDIPKVKDIHIDFNIGGKRSKASKMFENAISTLNNNNISQPDANKTFINKDNTIDISRDGKFANQYIRQTNNMIRSDVMDL